MTILGTTAMACGGSAQPATSPMGGSGSSGALAESPSAPGYEGGAQPTAQSAERSSEAPSAKADSSSRPGLGTEWGESRFSRISTVPFIRADADSPFAATSLFYNDAEGARAMANLSGFRRTSGGMANIASGAVQIGLRDESGNFLNGFSAGERDYVIGEAGSRYTIVVKNRTNTRFEAVISVDGLDVIDGRTAAFAKRGYLIDPHGELEVDGFRQSTETVAAFRFGSVRNSYAGQKTGDTRNVGVIGIALFHERGSSPWNSAEVQRRHDANPFPGQFATPPN